MKKQELLALKNKSIKELGDLLSKKRQEFIKTKLDIKTGKIKNVHAGRNLRRQIAVILTVLRNLQLEVKKS
ncbi:50S ribosomal protein L29 [Candidatus Microgenomates bacterium]|nr:50S ribosomal protein L29 [Candidatus Microgenomates bacterium]